MSSPRSEFFAGVKALAPLLLSVIPSSLINSAAAIGAGIPPLMVPAMSLIIFAGPAQLIVSQLLLSDTPIWLNILMASIINLRLMLYSLSLSPYLKDLSLRWKAVLAYLLTDPAYAVTIVRFTQAPRAPLRHWFLLGAGFTLWLTWQIGTSVGALLSVRLPTNLPLDFAIPLMLIAIVVPAIKDRAMLAAVLTAAFVMAALATLPLRLGLIPAALMGMLAGLWMDKRKS